jgi:hypothetical protein
MDKNEGRNERVGSGMHLVFLDGEAVREQAYWVGPQTQHGASGQTEYYRFTSLD